MTPRSTLTHAFVVDPTGRRSALAGLPQPTMGVVSGHLRLRGTFSAAGAVLRRIGPDLIALLPDLAQRYDLEILAAAPELGVSLTNRRESLTSLADPRTRTRYYPHDRVRWIGNGLTDLLLAYSERLGPQSLVVTDVDELDASDAQWLAGLVRRADPTRLRVVLVSRTGVAATPLDVTSLPRLRLTGADAAPRVPPDSAADRAWAYVRGECLSSDPALVGAYARLAAEEREVLHDRRAAELVDDPAWLLGALPFHLLRGSAAETDGLAAVEAAQARALMLGFYPTVVRHGATLREAVPWARDQERTWLATVKTTVAFQAMGEPDRAMDLFDEACAESTLPSVHMQCAYGRAMVYTRYYEPARQDLRKALGHIRTAVALAGLSTDEERRAYNRTFNENGLALVQSRLGRVAEAREAIEEGIVRLDREVANGRYLLHRSVLRYNHAQLSARDTSPEPALAEYDLLVEEDPFHPDYWFDRAGLLERAGRLEDAIADYTRAVEVGPPYPEPYYNRAELRLRLGEVDAALADFRRVLDLEPAFVDAYVNRASVLLEVDDLEGARTEIEAGLDVSPGHAYLLALRGQLCDAEGDLAAASDFLSQAVTADPGLAGAWANLGAVLFARGRGADAVEALERSLQLVEDPDVRDNLRLARSRLPLPAGAGHER